MSFSLLHLIQATGGSFRAARSACQFLGPLFGVGSLFGHTVEAGRAVHLYQLLQRHTVAQLSVYRTSKTVEEAPDTSTGALASSRWWLAAIFAGMPI